MIDSLADVLIMSTFLVGVVLVGSMCLMALAAWARESMWSFMLFLCVIVVITVVL